MNYDTRIKVEVELTVAEAHILCHAFHATMCQMSSQDVDAITHMQQVHLTSSQMTEEQFNIAMCKITNLFDPWIVEDTINDLPNGR